MVTDVTEHPTREGKVYCAVVLDVFSRRLVGWSIDQSATSGLVTSALGMAISNRQPDPETVIHCLKRFLAREVYQRVMACWRSLKFPRVDHRNSPPRVCC